MTVENLVVVVDENDNELGTLEKFQAHREAKLHRAVSVFIFNSKGEWLLQQRAENKYHSGSLWTNAACTHPFPEEDNLTAANRRLSEEMGIFADIRKIFDFVYKEKLDNNLTEYEFDHVFLGITDIIPKINVEEVMNYKYISFDSLKKDIQQNPDNYTVWFKKIFEKVYSYI